MIERQLKRKLKCKKRKGRRDHRYYDLWQDGQRLAFTFVSHGADDDIGDDLLDAMAQQLFVSKKTFLGMIDCPRSRSDVVSECLENQ